MDTFAVMFAVAGKLDLAIEARKKKDNKGAIEAVRQADYFMVEYARRHMVRGEPHPVKRAIIRAAAARYLAAAPLLFSGIGRSRATARPPERPTTWPRKAQKAQGAGKKGDETMPAVSHVYLGVAEFHDRLPELMRQVEREYLCVHISRRGRSMAVLVSEGDCSQNTEGAKARAGNTGWRFSEGRND